MLETIFESAIWRSRFIVILAVIFGLIGAIVLFVVASMDIWEVASYTFNTIIAHAHHDKFHEDIVAGIIGAVDLYLTSGEPRPTYFKNSVVLTSVILIIFAL